MSAYALIPHPAAPAFCMVRDWVPDRRSPEEKRMGRYKMPGGRVEPGETPGEAAKTEVAQETGLRVANPKARLIMVVHKTSLTEKPFYRAMFYVSAAPLTDEPIKPGAGIAEARWINATDIYAAIRGYAVNSMHAAAFLWAARRERYERTGDVSLLYPVLTRMACRSWDIADGVLTICADPQCSDCQPRPLPQDCRSNRNGDTGQPSPVIEMAPPFGKWDADLRSGSLGIVPIRRSPFEDFVLQQPLADGRFGVSFRRVTDGRHAAEIQRTLPRFCLVEGRGRDIAVVELTKRPKDGEGEFSMNAPPPRGMVSKTALAAIQEGLSGLGEKECLWFDRGWTGRKSNWLEVTFEIFPDKDGFPRRRDNGGRGRKGEKR